MNSKLTKLIFLYLSIIILAGTIPFIIFKSNQFQTSLDIIRTISILATSIFALLYFDPFGIKKKKMEKHYDNVTKILETFIGQRLILNHEDKSLVGYSQFVIKRDLIFNENISYLSDINDLKLIFELDNFINSQEELIKLKNHLWTPVEISKKLEFLEFRSATQIEKDFSSTHIKLYWNKMEPKKENEDKNFFSILNNKEYTLKEFVSNYKILILACEKWLEDNSFSKKGLNI